MVKEKEKALMLADLIASGEILSCLTVNEVTEELRALFRNVDADTQKEVVERICSVLN